MLFTIIILIPVQCEHDCLQQRVNLTQCHQPREMGHKPWLRLQEEKEVAVELFSTVVGKEGAVCGRVHLSCLLVASEM